MLTVLASRSELLLLLLVVTSMLVMSLSENVWLPMVMVEPLAKVAGDDEVSSEAA